MAAISDTSLPALANRTICTRMHVRELGVCRYMDSSFARVRQCTVPIRSGNRIHPSFIGTAACHVPTPSVVCYAVCGKTAFISWFHLAEGEYQRVHLVL